MMLNLFEGIGIMRTSSGLNVSALDLELSHSFSFQTTFVLFNFFNLPPLPVVASVCLATMRSYLLSLLLSKFYFGVQML